MKMKKVLSGVLAALLSVSSAAVGTSAYETPKQGTVPADSSVSPVSEFVPQRSAREVDEDEGFTAPIKLNSGKNEYRTGDMPENVVLERTDEEEGNSVSLDELMSSSEDEEPASVIQLNASADTYFTYNYKNGYVYNSLSSTEKRLYEKYYNASEYILNYSGDFSYYGSYDEMALADGGYIDVSGFDSNTVSKVFWLFRDDNPQFFFLANTFDYNNDHFYFDLYNEYASASSRKKVINAVTTEMNKHYSYLTGSDDAIYKEQYIAMIMCDKCSYDDANLNKNSMNWSHQTIGGYFLRDTVVCRGYAATFLLMCRVAGINCVYDEMEGVHAWNRVYLNDNWYVTDVTWMDQGTSEDIWFDYYNNSYDYINSIDDTGSHKSTYTSIKLPACNKNSSWFDIEKVGKGTSTYYSWIGNYYGTPFVQGASISVSTSAANGYTYRGSDIYDYIDGEYQLAFNSTASKVYLNIGGYDALCRTYYIVNDTSGVEAFVDRLYTIILDRHAESAGLKDWTNRLVWGKATSADLVYGIANSQEFTGKGLSNDEVIERMYLAMLGRGSDASGKADWLEAMANGVTVTGIINGFSGSAEFANVCSGYGIEAGSITSCEARDINVNLTEFVSRMYTKALGRDYDVYGLNDWTGDYLIGAATADKIAYGFILSDEFVNRNLSDEAYVDTLYRTFFNREPDAGGKSGWLTELANGASRKDVLDGFLGAEEFANLKSSFGV